MIGLWSKDIRARYLRFATGCFLIGIAVFSGSLYVLVITDTGWLGAITPVGGAAFILGWVALAASAVMSEDESR